MNFFEKAFNVMKSLISYYRPLDEAPSYIVTTNNLIRGTTTIYTSCDIPLDRLLYSGRTVPYYAEELAHDNIQPNPHDGFYFCPCLPTKSVLDINDDDDSTKYNVELPLDSFQSFYIFEDSSSLVNHTASDILDPSSISNTYTINTNVKNVTLNNNNNTDVMTNSSSSSSTITIDNPYDSNFIVFCKIKIFRAMNTISPLELGAIRRISIEAHGTPNGYTFDIHMMFYRKDVKRIYYILSTLYPGKCDFFDKPIDNIIHDDKDVVDNELSLTISNMTEILELTKVMNQNHIENLLKHVPTRYNNYSLKLVYSSYIHGTSLNNLYRHVNTYNEDVMTDTPYVMVIKDTTNKVFGAYLTEPLHLSRSYYGTGECFLFTFVKKGEINVYHWNTTSFTNFIYCDHNYIDIGSQDGFSALWIDESLYNGRSQQNNIFNNDPLSSKEYFNIYVLELWNFVE